MNNLTDILIENKETRTISLDFMKRVLIDHYGDEETINSLNKDQIWEAYDDLVNKYK